MNKAQREIVIRCVTDAVRGMVDRINARMADLDQRIASLEGRKQSDFRPGDEIVRDGKRFICTGQYHGKPRWRAG